MALYLDDLSDEAYDVLMDELPPWERSKVIKANINPKKPWGKLKWTLWWLRFVATTGLALVSIPIIIVLLIFPPFAVAAYFVGWLPWGITMKSFFHRPRRAIA